VAVGIVAAGLLIVVAVMYDWLARLQWLYPHKTELPLKVEGGEPHYHDWNYAASVAALPVMVTNKTGAPVTLPGGCTAELNADGIPLWSPSLTEAEKGSFLQETESQKRTSHHQPSLVKGATIPAHASLELWYVTEIGRDRSGTRPGATLRFKDSGGNEYAAVFKRHEPHRARSESSLTGNPGHGSV